MLQSIQTNLIPNNFRLIDLYANRPAVNAITTPANTGYDVHSVTDYSIHSSLAPSRVQTSLLGNRLNALA